MSQRKPQSTNQQSAATNTIYDDEAILRVTTAEKGVKSTSPSALYADLAYWQTRVSKAPFLGVAGTNARSLL